MKIEKNSNRRPKPTTAQYLKQNLTASELSRLFSTNKNIKKAASHIRNTQKKRDDFISTCEGISGHPANTIELAVPEWFEFKTEPIISVIIPLYRSESVIEDNIRSWDNNCSIPTEIIYIDDACPSRSHEKIISSWKSRDCPSNGIGRILVNDSNQGFGTTNNIAAKHARGKYLVFLNADTLVTLNWLQPMFDLLHKDPGIGIVGNLQISRNGMVISLGSEWYHDNFVHSGVFVDRGKTLEHPYTLSSIPQELLRPHEKDMVTAACSMMPSKLFFEVGGFDQDYKKGYFEDSDLNMKVRQLGKKIMVQPKSVIVHYGSHSKSNNHPHVAQNAALFKSRWTQNGHIILTQNKPKLFVSKNNVVVYTAITSNYDCLKEQDSANVKFVAFIDNPINSQTWEIRPAINFFTDPNRNAKIYKMLPHIYFPDYEFTLWVDGSIQLKCPVDWLVEKFIGNNDLVIHRHPIRNNIYDEARVCIERRLDDENIVIEQIQKYQNENFMHADLAEATIILRRNTEITRKFNEAWWEEVCNYSRRDQLSFNYIAKKVGLKIGYFEGTFRDKKNPYFSVAKHDGEI